MSQLPNQKSFHQIFNDYFKTVEFLGYIKAGILFFATEKCFHAFLVCSSGWQAFPRDLWLFSTYKFVCLCSGGREGWGQTFSFTSYIHDHRIRFSDTTLGFWTFHFCAIYWIWCSYQYYWNKPVYQYVVQLFQWSKHSFSLVLFCIKRSMT